MSKKDDDRLVVGLDIGTSKIVCIVAEMQAEGTLEVIGMGTFPNPRNARVVWVGLSGDREKLSRLQAAVEETLSGIGFERDERPFTPHLTLGRIKYIRSRDKLLTALEEVKDVHLPGFDVSTVSLMKSELRPSGAVYTEMGRVELK